MFMSAMSLSQYDWFLVSFNKLSVETFPTANTILDFYLQRVQSTHGLVTTVAYKFGNQPAVYALEGKHFFNQK